MISSIKGRSVLVTGASRGIGKGIAQGFAAAGARVLIAARSQEGAQAAVDAIQAEGGIAAATVADVTDRDQLVAAVDRAVELYGELDVLCANAGIFPDTSLEQMTEAQWDEVVDTNLKGCFLSVQAAIPALKKSEAGRVVVTSSITGPITGFPGWTHYGASKAGQLGFIRTAAIELAKYGITVNAVMPGNIVTEGLEAMGEDYLRQMAAAIPLKRLGGVADIANAALYFASREAGYVTGQTLVIDGGQILPESFEAVG
ncbi:3-ketoacyl-ACP reductase [Salinisphaera orenii MK-B5]|uniref:3-ketoacyl-ACP reductase n=1 Tax=Salinisphaera orenii MK-B5 TaxID=856730 RepID=A0A423PH72_9GAMM|nr:3-oxoacyl-ACP reductase FabG [Salinisphaera orenii]ROO24962.1 3-ketoacyl-ACP reductase [Salinisphaera orenii MK-B5]